MYVGAITKIIITFARTSYSYHLLALIVCDLTNTDTQMVTIYVSVEIFKLAITNRR